MNFLTTKQWRVAKRLAFIIPLLSHEDSRLHRVERTVWGGGMPCYLSVRHFVRSGGTGRDSCIVYNRKITQLLPPHPTFDFVPPPVFVY